MSEFHIKWPSFWVGFALAAGPSIIRILYLVVTDYRLCRTRELHRQANNIAAAWDELQATPPNVTAATRCLEWANEQSREFLPRKEVPVLRAGRFASFSHQRAAESSRPMAMDTASASGPRSTPHPAIKRAKKAGRALA